MKTLAIFLFSLLLAGGAWAGDENKHYVLDENAYQVLVKSGLTVQWLPPQEVLDWEGAGSQIQNKEGWDTIIWIEPKVIFKYRLGLRSDGVVVWEEVD